MGVSTYRRLMLSLAICLAFSCKVDHSIDRNEFKSPDRGHYPQTWFHFIGDNVSLEGITADLEAIAQAGISGVHFFHGQLDNNTRWPEVEDGIVPLSEEWYEAVRYIAQECDRLDLDLTIQNCPGWAMAGGPWIKPENAMRGLVYSRTDVSAENSDIVLSRPEPSSEPWRDYQDIAVLAFPTPKGDTGKPVKVKNISGTGNYDWEKVFADKVGYVEAVQPSDHPYIVNMDFAEPVTIRTVQLPSINSFSHAMCFEPCVSFKIAVTTSDGDETVIADFPLPSANWQDDDPLSIACPEVEDAVSCRMEIKVVRKEMNFNKIRFYTAARKNSWESEAGKTLRAFERTADDVRQSLDAYVDINSIIDISDRLSSDGSLDWKTPDDRMWTVLRIGHVNEGKKNAPAPPEGTGWECDKLSTDGAEAHFAGYVSKLADGALDGGLLDAMLLDSWECSTQMWTRNMESEFQSRCGYELRKWLPALLGYVVNEPQTTSRFLLDWRGTVGYLFAEKFYRRMSELAHSKGLKVTYETAAGDVVPADIMEYFKYADIPMCEFWQPFNKDGYVGSLNFKPIKPTASAARLYGKERVVAESFTSFALTWDETLEMLKEYADYHFIEGVTYNVFHTYTHNPQVDYLKPGTSFGGHIGTPFLRGQTWWPYMKEFTTYLARCSYMLEAGRPVSEVLWYLGDEISHKPDQEYDFPQGYRYDYCNPDVLLNRLSVKDGRIVTPEGISYSMLWIPENKRMNIQTLRKLHSLISDGAKVAAAPPQMIATLIGGEEAEAEFQEAVDALWGGLQAGESANLGRGCLLNDTDINTALDRFDIRPDLIGDVRWIHRQDKDFDWYFITPLKESSFSGTISLRTEGKAEIWNPVTGETSPINTRREGEYTLIDLDIPARGSCFVVVDRTHRQSNMEKVSCDDTLPLDGIWTLRFPEGWGAPDELKVTELEAWCNMPISEEARSFSGTVKYSTEFQASQEMTENPVILEIEKISSIAEVKVNGQSVGTLWCPPYSLDISDHINPGNNVLEIDVTSTWFNRLTYDAGLDESYRKTWVIHGPASGSELRPYGLLGSIVVRYCEK